MSITQLSYDVINLLIIHYWYDRSDDTVQALTGSPGLMAFSPLVPPVMPRPSVGAFSRSTSTCVWTEGGVTVWTGDCVGRERVTVWMGEGVPSSLGFIPLIPPSGKE